MPERPIGPPFVSNPALSAAGDDSILPDLNRGLICAVLGCGRIAQTTYVAAEDGELAGWPWKRGDELHFCWPHARNLYNGRDPLWEDGMPRA